MQTFDDFPLVVPTQPGNRGGVDVAVQLFQKTSFLKQLPALAVLKLYCFCKQSNISRNNIF